ncbi:MAG: hypothetical protein BECKG1743D_GA0114223_108922 [Candidatus Kentron sp. G]|nr:MAG: hypothetical protein BECKG1743D_GA0114223_108922 [Candidatus Kentron sp. G]
MIHEGHEGTRRRKTKNTKKYSIFSCSFVDHFFHWLRLGRAILLSVVFLFFLHAFHAIISIRCWFAIDIEIRYRYRSCPAFPIASSDSDPERTTTPVAARRASTAALKFRYHLG